MKRMWKVTKKNNIISAWVLWHYGVALPYTYKRWGDVCRFNYDYFSIPFLLKTFFTPWRKYSFSYQKGFDAARFFEALTFNAFSRFMGALVRAIVIFIGIISQVVVSLLGLLVVFFWIIVPLLTILSLLFSLRWLI